MPSTDSKPARDHAVELTVVVPVRNEAENIGRLIDEILAALTGVVGFEIVYVNDGSTDGTARVLAERAAIEPRLRVIEHAASRGQSVAVLTGVRAARGAWIATLDGDGQNDPADLPAMLERRGETDEDGRPVRAICGWRTGRKDTRVKKISSKIANGVRSRVLRDSTPDTGCGIKLFDRDAFLTLPHFNHMHRFLPALFQRHGWASVSVPVNHRPRDRGSSKYGTLDRLRVGLVDMLGVAWLQRRPVRAEAREVTPHESGAEVVVTDRVKQGGAAS